MIHSFADSETQCLFEQGFCEGFPPEIQKRALKKLECIDSATIPQDLLMPPGNRLHAVNGNRSGRYVISINDDWDIYFQLKNDGAYDVKICAHQGE